MNSYSKIDKQNRYSFDMFKNYSDIKMQNLFNKIRISIDYVYYINMSDKEEAIELINKMINEINFKTDEDRIELTRRTMYHLSKHIILRIFYSNYDIQTVYMNRWSK